MSGLLGVAYVDVRARLTGFEQGLRTGVQREIAGTAAAFNTGGARLNRAAGAMEGGLKARLAGFASKSGLSAVAGEVNRATSAIGIPLKVALPGAAAVAGIAAVKMAGTFQSQMQLLVTAAGESQRAIKGMGDQVLQVARDTGTSTSQLTAGLYNLEKAGYRGAAATKVLGVAAEGARAEGANLGVVVTGLTSLMASYHIPAGDATRAMNQIIVAAGESKTNMENFANSLSTVIPIASAAHISFAEVAGAIATLTQHGTSAAESTQELSSLIRNLQAPNQSAARAFQQLGIGVNSLQLGLSNPRVGLIGTLNRVIETLGKHTGRAGLIAVDAFKKSESATQDLSFMLQHMSPHLKGISQQFLDGGKSASEYRKEVRGMGASGAAQGLQFMTLAMQSRGFNDLIKSGQPALRTYVAALRQLTGGAIGLNTTLQITGHNMPGFEERTRRVAAASKLAGDHVMTWSSVQQSFNVQMGRLRQVVDTAFISLGLKLLPAIQRAATATFNWFEGLHRGGSIFADTQSKFGPLAGAVDFVHTAFVGATHFVSTSVIPAMIALWGALQPLLTSLWHAAAAATHFAVDALQMVGHFLVTVIGPALVSGARWLGTHAAAIKHDGMVIAELIVVLAVAGTAIRVFGAAVVGTSIVISGFRTVMAAASLAVAAFASRQDAVAFMQLFTRSTIAANIAIGAQAIVMGIVRAATTTWAAATLLLDAALTAGSFSAFAAEAGALVRTIPIVVGATRLWTLAQLQLDAAMDANPVGMIILAIGLLVIAIISIVNHFRNVRAALGDVFGAVGSIVHNLIGVLGGLLEMLTAIFTLDGHKLLNSLENLGRSLLSLPVDVLSHLASGVQDLLGIDDTINIHPHYDLSTLHADVRTQMAGVRRSIDGAMSSINITPYDKFNDVIKSTSTSLRTHERQLEDLSKVRGKDKITVDGHTWSMKQFDAATKLTHGSNIQAAALLETLGSRTTMYKSAVDKLDAAQRTYNSTMTTTSKNLGLSAGDLAQYGTTMQITAGQIATGKIGQVAFQNAAQDVQYALSSTSGSVNNLVSQLITYQNSSKSAADQTNLFKVALDALAGNSQDVNTAIAQANTQVHDLASSLKNTIGPGKHASDQLFSLHGNAIKLRGSGAQLQVGMSQIRSQLMNVASAVINNGGSWRDATKAYDHAVKNVLPQLASQLHLSGTQVQTLNSFLALTPAAKKILLNMPGLTQSNAGMETLLTYLESLHDKTVHVNVVASGSPSGRSGRGTKSTYSANGNIFRSFAGGGGFGSSLEDHVAQIAPGGAWRVWAEPETEGEGYIPLARGKRRRSEMLMAQIAHIFGGTYVPNVKMFADGGLPHITTRMVGGKKRWVVNGKLYASLSAAENARTSAGNRDQTSLAQGVATAIGNIGQPPAAPRIDLSQVSITRVRQQIEAASKALDHALNEGLSRKKVQALAHQLQILVAQANRALGNLELKIKTTDLNNVRNQITSLFSKDSLTSSASGNELSDAISQMITDATNAGASSKLISQLRSQNQTLMRDVQQRNTIAGRLQNANQALADVQQKFSELQTSVTGAISNTFDITTAGNFNGYATLGSVMSGLQRQANAALQFSSDITKLATSGISPSLVSQLAAAGPAAEGTVKALLTATPDQLAQINTMQKQVNAAAASAGTTTANVMYGAGVAAAQGLVNGLNSQLGTLQTTMKRLADTMVGEIKKQLKIHSPSGVFHDLMYDGVGAGAVSGLVASQDMVATAAASLGHAAAASVDQSHLTARHGRGAHGGSLVINNHVTASPGMNVETLANRVSERQAVRVRHGIKYQPRSA